MSQNTLIRWRDNYPSGPNGPMIPWPTNLLTVPGVGNNNCWKGLVSSLI